MARFSGKMQGRSKTETDLNPIQFVSTLNPNPSRKSNARLVSRSAAIALRRALNEQATGLGFMVFRFSVSGLGFYG